MSLHFFCFSESRDPTLKLEVFGVSSISILTILAIIREAITDKPTDVVEFEKREDIIEEYLVINAEFYAAKHKRNAEPERDNLRVDDIGERGYF